MRCILRAWNYFEWTDIQAEAIQLNAKAAKIKARRRAKLMREQNNNISSLCLYV